jgi:hypothetical protein
MTDLYITFALPNPAGKDRPPYSGPSDVQLNGEWIQFLNTSGKQLDMNGTRLFHQTFDRHCQRTGQDEVANFLACSIQAIPFVSIPVPVSPRGKALSCIRI